MKTSFALGLRGRLILLLVAAFAAVLAILAWQILSHGAERVANVTDYLLHRAQLIASHQQQIAVRADAILNGLMLRPELRPGATLAECERYYSARTDLAREFAQIGRVSPDGDILCTAIPVQGEVNVADRAWFRQARATEAMVVSDVLRGRIIGKETIALSRARRDAAGKVTDVFYVALDFNWLQASLASGPLAEGARLIVVDAHGAVLAQHPADAPQFGKQVGQAPLFRAIAARGDTGTLEVDGLGGGLRIVAYTPLLETISGPIRLWLSVPKDTVTAPVRRELIVYLAFTGGLLLILTALVYRGGEKLLVRPLLALSRAAARLGSGDLSTRTALHHGDDEVGQLARAFDAMADAVQTGEQKLAHADRALRVLSAGNRTLLKSETEQELLEQMCHAIVEAGDYRLVWVGYAEDDKRVRLVASAGAPADFTDSLDITWDDTASGQGPTGTAIREGVAVAINDALTDPAYAPWRERARRFGYAASIALPLHLENAIIGALNIYAAERDAFGADVVKLLSECADDVSFGIASRRADAELGHAQDALRSAEERFRRVATASLDALFILRSVRDPQGEIVDFEFIDINPSGDPLCQCR